MHIHRVESPRCNQAIEKLSRSGQLLDRARTMAIELDTQRNEQIEAKQYDKAIVTSDALVRAFAFQLHCLVCSDPDLSERMQVLGIGQRPDCVHWPAGACSKRNGREPPSPNEQSGLTWRRS